MNTRGLILPIEEEYLGPSYSVDEIISIINHYTSFGLKQIQIIDLADNFALITRLRQQFPKLILIGGGAIDSFTRADQFIDAGCDCIVVGRELVKNQAKIADYVEKYQDKLIASVDDAQGFISGTQVVTRDYLNKLITNGVKNILLVDTDKILTAQGIDGIYLEQLIKPFLSQEIRLIYSGGINNLADILLLKNFGFTAIIAGTAIYNGRLLVQEINQIFK